MIQSIDARTAQDLIASGELDVVDVREPNEWANGHVPGSRLLPLGRLRAAPRASLPRDGIIFICAAGIRSETAARVAVGLGYTRVYNLVGGTRGWTQSGLGVEHDARREAATG
jgi:rhodanese-related sulfurtransferase